MHNTRHAAGLVAFTILTVGCLSLTAQQRQDRSPANLRLSGTYELERTRGGDPRRTAEAATRSVAPGRRDRAYQDLVERLESPQSISISRDGRQITIASSRGPRASFAADGRNQRERGDDGRMVTTRADLNGDELRVTTSSGARGTDYSVTFTSQQNGNALRVTRRVDDDDLPRAVTIDSYYRRTQNEARWDIYDEDRGVDRNYDDRSTSNGPLFMVPGGMRLLATLDTPLSMRTSRHRDPFAMTVRGPSDFEGARITGVVSRVNGYRDEGGQDMRIDFQTIEYRGRTSDFRGSLETVRLSDGTIFRVSPDGDVRDRNQTNDTLRNGGIGATVGAIIGAIAGGGKGAAVGAIIGGAGGVILSQGHEQLDLPRGADVTLTSDSRGRR